MTEYIEKGAAISAIMIEPPDAHYPHWYEDKIKSIPAADVAPVRHGRWEQTTEPLGWDEIGCVECSECQESFIIGEDFGIDDISYFWHFCPNCGARMEGGSE